MPNNIASALQRTARINAVMRGFKRRVTPILAFALRAEGEPLQGNDKMAVRFYDLDSTASKDFAPASGYVFDQDSTTGSREVTINKRKYKPLVITSSEASRQPMLDPTQLLEIKGEKLAEDVVNDILSVVTADNYGASVKEVAAASFDSDDVIDIRAECNLAQWPQAGRALVLDSAYDTALFKDGSIKNAAAFGGREAVREGRIPELLGFNYHDVPGLPSNAERLVGFAAFQSAVLVGFAPISPTEAVRKNLLAYDLIPVEVAPGIHITLEYRAWGDPDYDQTREVIECNYGYAKGNESALKRITAPAGGG